MKKKTHLQLIEEMKEHLLTLEKQQNKQKVHIDTILQNEKFNQMSNRQLKEIEKKIVKYLDNYLKETFEAFEEEMNKMRSRIQRLEKELAQEKERKGPVSPNKDPSPRIFVDNLTLDKLITINNIAQLGVKDLSGKLNIGTAPLESSAGFEKEQSEETDKNE
ncbi:hypothetical protein [Halobacillus sp. BBL2006]|uniref:hypothetical protein n=1 Tax=Halobacillus sp. BBL2006 TaxID=1543706 RepID=UPI00054347CD|nr:hypothetical protein [Halobacillus sp. BBL2006]KHE72758.1 hypothetical protein LD39_02865 [Halobacillus sp. BBL2006]